MGVAALLQDLARRGVDLSTDGATIRWRNSRGLMTPEVIGALRTQRTDAIAILTRADREAYLADRFEELAAILEYDEHMSRAEAERAALRIINGGKA